MPKDRKLTYSDRQAQAARDKKQSVRKSVTIDPSPTPPPAKTKRKR